MVVVVFRGNASAVGELDTDAGQPAIREWTGAAGCRKRAVAHGRTRADGGAGVVEPGGRHWDGAGLERKVRATGRAWTVGDIATVADGQWAVGLSAPAGVEGDTAVEGRAADGQSVQMTVEVLPRAVGAHFGDAHGEADAG